MIKGLLPTRPFLPPCFPFLGVLGVEWEVQKSESPEEGAVPPTPTLIPAVMAQVASQEPDTHDE